MKTIYCMALTGERTIGVAWYYSHRDRDAAQATASGKVYFTIEVDDELSREDIATICGNVIVPQFLDYTPKQQLAHRPDVANLGAA